MSSEKPYLSVVAVSRNDDHGKNLKQRMQIFVSGFIEQCKRFNLDAELILVDWNPPEGKPGLDEALNYPIEGGTCTVRIVTVPPELHYRLNCSKQLPLFQMIGKNVGIRRARGEFVLCTNIDVLFSSELIKFMADRKLEKGHYYRVDRWDADEDVPPDQPVEEQLEYCRNNVLRINGPGGIFTPEQLRSNRKHEEQRNRIHQASRERGLFARLRYSWRKEYVRVLMYEGLRRGSFGAFFAALRNYVAAIKEYRMYRKFMRLDQRMGRWRIPALHTMACGDFTMMHREDWYKFQAYGEYEIYSMHIDSLGVFQAHYAGIKEVYLREPLLIYHIEHGQGSGWTPEGARKLNDRLRKAGIPQLKWRKIRDMVRYMYMSDGPLKYNEDNWGFADHDLPEVVFEPGRSPARGADRSSKKDTVTTG